MTHSGAQSPELSSVFKRIIGSIHGNLRIQLDPNNCNIFGSRTDVSVDFCWVFVDLFRKAQAAPTVYPFLLSMGHEFFCARTLLYRSIITCFRENTLKLVHFRVFGNLGQIMESIGIYWNFISRFVWGNCMKSKHHSSMTRCFRVDGKHLPT